MSHYVVAAPDSRTERDEAVTQTILEFCWGRNKIALEPWDPDKAHPELIYVEKLNGFLRSRGFDDYEVVHQPFGELTIRKLPPMSFR